MSLCVGTFGQNGIVCSCLKMRWIWGYLAGSVRRAYDSGSRGHEFEPHVGMEITLKQTNFFKNEVDLYMLL